LENKKIEELFSTNLKKGLTKSEALKRLEKYGFNKLAESKKRAFLLRLFDQLKDFMIAVLLIASLISIITGDIIEGILIILIVILNAFFGIIQESKADKSLDSIKKLASPKTLVIRDGIQLQIDSQNLVEGDLVEFEAGDYIPADLRIISSINLKIDESALTGESVSVLKDESVIKENNLALADLKNMAFMSTFVTYGKGSGIVVKTGMNTQIGKIANMIFDSEKNITPLQKNINALGKSLAIIALLITGSIFLIELIIALFSNSLSFNGILGAFTFAVALAVAAIPEGLPAIITIILSLGMSNLVKKKAIMKTLSSVETLGSTNIICSDKTGTITQNIMNVEKLYLNNKIFNTSNINIDNHIKKLISFAVLASDVKIRRENDAYIKIGDPTEIALINLAIKYNLNPIDINYENPQIYEYPFDSNRKLMSSVNKIGDEYYLVVKGAPDIIFKKSINLNINNEILKLDDFYIDSLTTANNKMGKDALRVLAVAYKKIDKNLDFRKYSADNLENELTFLGLVGMIDSERPEIESAIVKCKKAGISTIMITGDHQNTAVAIAKKVGILSDGDLAITGKDLDDLDDDAYLEKIEKIKVYARVSPENKVRIVNTWKKLGKIVAMTGDGVNDAPSIKNADIGIAMGITGSEVAKGAADMILTDDNFATIVDSIEEGRGIFSNIKKAIHFLLSCNVGEIIVMFLGVTIGFLLFKNETLGTTALHILSPVQLLWVNLVTDSLMALALGVEKVEDDIMDQPPRDSNKSIFADSLGKTIIFQGIMIGLLTFVAFIIGWNWKGVSKDNQLKLAGTMAFMVLSLSQLFHAFNVRSLKRSNFKMKVNKNLIYAFFISFAIQVFIVIFPFTLNLFGILRPSFMQWLIILLLSVFPLVLIEIIKLIKTKKQ